MQHQTICTRALIVHIHLHLKNALYLILKFSFCFDKYPDFPIPNGSRQTQPLLQRNHQWRRQSNGNSWRCWRKRHRHPTGHRPNERLCAHHQSCVGRAIRHCVRQACIRSNAQVSASQRIKHNSKSMNDTSLYFDTNVKSKIHIIRLLISFTISKFERIHKCVPKEI